MKFTLVTGEQGDLVAIVRSHLSDRKPGPSEPRGMHAALRVAPGQAFHELDDPEVDESTTGDKIRQLHDQGRWIKRR